MRNKSLGDINKLNNGQLGGLPMRVGHRVGVVVGPPWMGLDAAAGPSSVRWVAGDGGSVGGTFFFFFF